MEPEPEKLDLSALDPAREPRWERTIATVTARAIALRRLRRAVVRRGMVAMSLAAAAAVVLWWSAPQRRPAPQPHATLLDWAVRDVEPGDVLAIGVGDAQ